MAKARQTDPQIRDRQVLQLAEATRKALRRSRELMEQTEKLLAQSRLLMLAFRPQRNDTYSK